jgi:hypothetical protein
MACNFSNFILVAQKGPFCYNVVIVINKEHEMMREVYDFYFDGGREARFGGESYQAALKQFQDHFPYEVERVEQIQEEV